MKKVLFINSSFELGGIETFLVRAAEKLEGKVKFTLLLMSDSINIELLDKFKRYGNVVFLKDILLLNITKYAILRTILPLNKSKVRALFNDIDIIHASCSFSLPLMRRVSSILNENIIESIGVYHSREFLWGDKSRLMRKKQISLFSDVSAENIIFMNDYTVSMYSSTYNKNYKNALPIGIEIERYMDCLPNARSGRIVSIGRLVDFKTYNYHMIMCLAKLESQYRKKITFEIYGDGPEMENLKKMADDKNINAKFLGKLEYNEMPAILNGASLFVGSGTAIVEAAAAGVPCIIGIESIQKPLTYGFITETKGLSFQEMGLDYPMHSYSDVINNLCSMSEDDYASLSAKHRVRAKVFSSDNMEKTLMNYYCNLSKCTDKSDVGFLYIIGIFNWLLMNKFKINNERKTMYDF